MQPTLQYVKYWDYDSIHMPGLRNDEKYILWYNLYKT